MGKSKVVPKRLLHATESLTLTPPDNLTESQTIARVVSGAGNNLYNVELPTSFQKLEGSDAKAASVLVELPAQFRNAIWLKRGSYVVVDTAAQERRENKIRGSIVNVVRDERAWRKEKYWYVLEIPIHAPSAFDVD